MKSFVASIVLPKSEWWGEEGFFRPDVSRLAAVIGRVQSASASIPVLQPVKLLARDHFPAQQRGIVLEFGDRSDATLHKVLSQFAGPDSGPTELGLVASLRPFRGIDLPVASRSASKLAYERQLGPDPDWVAHRLALK